MKASKKDLHETGRPLTSEEFVEKIKTDDEFAKKWGELGPVYGKQWRRWKQREFPFGGGVDNKETIYVDQIANLVQDLINNPDSRRLMVNAWNVGEIDQMVLPPCHYGFQLYTRELNGEERWELLKQTIGNDRFNSIVSEIVPFGGGLSEELEEYNIPKRTISLMWNQRSVDTFLGLPFNIASYGLLLEILAKEVNMVPDQLIGNLGDTHLYSNHIEQSREQIKRDSFDLPKVNVNDSWKFGSSSPIFADKLKLDMFKLVDYQSYGPIKAPLSN